MHLVWYVTPLYFSKGNANVPNSLFSLILLPSFARDFIPSSDSKSLEQRISGSNNIL